MTTLVQDLRYALRQLRKTPAFTVTVLVTLALGIGATSAIFTLVHAVLLKNLPVADPRTLVWLGNWNDCCVSGGLSDDGNYALFSTDTYQQLRKNAAEFEELAAMQAGFEYRPIIVRREKSQTQARSVTGEFVSGNYFRTFGLQPTVGRMLTDEDDVEGGPNTAVMSYEAWQRDFAGDGSVIGSTFWINTQPATVVGIAPKGFYGDRLSSTPPDFYLPIETMPVLANVPYVHKPDTNWLYIVGRVKTGTALPALQQKVSAILRVALGTHPNLPPGDEKYKALARAHITLTPGGAGIQAMQEEYSSQLRLLMWVAGLVLLIACANVANLLLVRGMGRRVEMSVRTALGAMRMRIIRQLLTESVLLAALGGIVGLAVAYVGARMLLTLAFPDQRFLPIDASPSLSVIGFAFGLSLLTGVLFGAAPAGIVAQAQPVDALHGGSRTTTTGASLLQRGLVVLQAALSLVLLIGAGLFAKSLNKLESTDLKLDAKNRYIVHISPQTAGYLPMQLEAFYRTVEQQFHALPGMETVGISTYTPMEENNWSEPIQVQGRPSLDKEASWVRGNPEYFQSVGTHVLMGRGIGIQDTSTARTVAVVNQSFVKKFLPDGNNPIGQHFGAPGPMSCGDFEVVGVVEDTAYTTVRWKNHAMYFVPMTQRPASWKSKVETDESMYAGALVLETDRPMSNLEGLVRTTLAHINPNLTVMKFQTFDAQIADRFKDERMLARLTTLFSVLALMLAAVGLYGVTSYTVARRASEIGIRMALGAKRRGVIAIILRGAMIQSLLGLVIGAPVAILCLRFVKAQLYEINSVGSGVVVAAIATLAVAACIAGLIPARRAASIDPVNALRSE